LYFCETDVQHVLGNDALFRGGLANALLMNDSCQLPSIHATKLFFIVGEVVPPDGVLVSGEETSDANGKRDVHGMKALT